MTVNSEMDAFIDLEFIAKSEAEMKAAADNYYRAMSKRRTVRDFSSRPVAKEIIDKAIGAAGSAPSGANHQPWHFVVIANQQVKHEIRLAAEEEERKFYQQRASAAWLEDLAPLGTNEHKPFLEVAPYLITIFAQKFSFDEAGAKHKNYYTAESVGIATGMLISALHLSGLATLTHTPSPMKFLNRILSRPETEKPYLLLAVGYPATNCKVPNISRKSINDICTYFG